MSWKSIGGALFVTVGKCSVASENANMLLTLTALAAYLCVQQASLVASSSRKALVLTCLGASLQLPIFAITLLDDSWPILCNVLVVLAVFVIVSMFMSCFEIFRSLPQWVRVWSTRDRPTQEGHLPL